MSVGHDHGAGTGGHDHRGRSGARGHDHDYGQNTSRLKWTLALVVGYMIAEVVGGLASGSLALLADAGHMLSDAASLALALFAMWIARRPPNSVHTFGYYRTEILAALVNGVTLVVISLFIFREAYARFSEPPEVAGGLMMGVAAGGLGVNLIGLYLLESGRKENLNVRGAWLHVMADAAGSFGALVAGALIWWRGWGWADPTASVLIAALVLVSSWSILKESVAVLMQAAPGHLDLDAVRERLAQVPGVDTVHDLHIWTVTSGMVSASTHVVTTGTRPDEDTLTEVRSLLREEYGIEHCTVQLEPDELEEPPTPI